MTGVERKVETEWLACVLQTLKAAGKPTTLEAVEALRDRVVVLAWDERAPRASLFQGMDAEDRFRRHPLASVDALGCSALLMYWPPGHATLPHDHGGLWGIEVVIDGALSINEFVRIGNDREGALAPAGTQNLEVGDAAVFESARYVHRCRNLSNVHPTLTLHIYGGALDAYRAFSSDDEGRLVTHAVTPRCDALLS
jgi:hypothetical protein